MTLVWLALVGCSTHSNPAEETPIEIGEAAAGADVAAMLLARHPEDLPPKDVIDANGGAPALRAVADTADELVVRERALALLALYGDAETGAFCRRWATGADVHDKLRAAAIRCLGGQDLATDADLRGVVVGGLSSEDPRVAIAAVDVLASVPGARDALVSTRGGDTVDPDVAARIDEVLALTPTP